LDKVPRTPFEAADYPNRPGVRRYDKIVRFSSIPFVKAGWLMKNKGLWLATDEGLNAARRYRDPEAFMREAVRHYEHWKKQRVLPSDLDEAEETTSDVAVVATYEEAEEAAFEEIEAYVEAMPPYEFQDLVAALLDAMGYHVMWVAPPGPDRGIDIIAGADQLGITDPRIKVQVRHREATADVADLRAFMAVLGTRDVGIFVSMSGFTKDAQTEARTHDTRKLTLLDLSRLLDLWDRQLRPGGGIQASTSSAEARALPGAWTLVAAFARAVPLPTPQ
jgi:restriction system protein